ncbi:arsenite efflux transporter metallochaperone ArsD [Shewanella profunda]|uniref:arsenite efflux transporter metallochaperone ArsD n=1 Tax=Shewanella profunda TaxID=254793 RepID=UPI00200C8A37|nr:arsenite efflux transporter metallochaperone ArsD [Shewanella profunda]MCL1089135.1 arsenite efflux transporter metallochaperone ArsD [Shewanella profunda]
MTQFSIFDPALCCSSGVCGTDVDQALVTFSADCQWLKQQGVTVDRFNLSQQPMAFAENPLVRRFLETSGAESLPLILLNGEMILAGRYPSRQELARWANITVEAPATTPSSCCSGKTSCC